MNRVSEIFQKELQISQKWINWISFFVLCLMSVQPFVGLTGHIETNDDTIALFLLKSNLVRGLGCIALLLALIFSFLGKKQSFLKTIKEIFAHKPWNVFFFLLLIWTILMHFHAPFTYVSLFGDPVRYEGIFGYFAYAGFFALASLIQDRRFLRWWMNFTLICAAVLDVISLYCLWNPNDVILSYMNDVTGGFSSTFPQYNHYAYYLAMMTMASAGLFLYTKGKISHVLYTLSFALQLFTLIQNHTRGGFLAVCVAMIGLTILTVLRRDVSKLSIVILWILFVIITLSSGSLVASIVGRTASDFFSVLKDKDADYAGSGRIRLWKTTLKIIKDHPIFGCGTDMAHYYLDIYGISKEMPHNEYLQHTANLGIPGIVMYLGALISLLVHCLRRVKKLPAITVIAGCTVLAYAVSAFFGVTITIILPFFYIFLGICKQE